MADLLICTQPTFAQALKALASPTLAKHEAVKPSISGGPKHFDPYH
jgi:hypothetical protein